MKSIANNKHIISKENLPFPIVLYPDFYGTYFAFKSKETDDKIYVCSCSKEAIQNYIKIKLSNNITDKIEHRIDFVNPSDFPIELISRIKNKNAFNKNKFIAALNFENKICHECNNATPNYKYCHEMYGCTFKQNYGWYINKKANEYGIHKQYKNYSLLPHEIRELIIFKSQVEYTAIEYLALIEKYSNQDINKIKTLKGKYINSLATHEFYMELLEPFNQEIFDAKYKIDKLTSKQNRQIWKIIENEVRQKFGHKKIGEAWTSETILYYNIEKIFPKYKIKRHYRPNILNGLELDIFISDLNIGIEYQGIQHFKPIKHWGGSEALAKLQYRDKLKKELCMKNNIRLIYFNFNEELSESEIRKRVSKFI